MADRGGGRHRQGSKPGRSAVPEKICATCGRPFSWRRKWARDWDEVRYCSQACRAGRRDSGFVPR
ncbi:DUF2256 domain-containing protein [Nocardioides sp. R-C-SC26]|uniref:DUF2256 domain-containing protein n=1 Tax=Nocardioides sp. R-C-SC26 TaxID=2870414 RepID=UPI001E5173FD|nr:DUF2256 domain-containing protein [Nocardioides sp. R-C-SC26]